MGMSIITLGGGGVQEGGEQQPPRSVSRRVFLVSNYMLVGAASSCIFLTLSLRLIPSLDGFLLIFLHLLTIAAAISGCAATSSSSSSPTWYPAHMAATVLTAIFQGSVAVLSFTRTAELLGALKSYVVEENGKTIVKMAGGIGVVIIVLEWFLLTLAFFLNYYSSISARRPGPPPPPNSSNPPRDDLKDWPWPFQV